MARLRFFLGYSGPVEKSGSDSCAVALTESRTVAVTSSRADTAAVALTEVRTLYQALARADTVAVALTESRLVSQAVARSDSVAVGITEAKAVTYAIARADSLSVALTEARTLYQARAPTDSVAVGLTESRLIEAAIPRADGGGGGLITKNGSTFADAVSAHWSNVWTTGTFAVGSGTDRILVVSVKVWSGLDTLTGIKWGGSGGVALTKAYSRAGNSEWEVGVWYLVNPTVQTAALYLTFDDNINSCAVGATVWDNGAQTDPFSGGAYAEGYSSTPSRSVASAVGSLVIDCLVHNGTFDHSNQTLDTLLNNTFNDGATSHAAGAASVTMSYDFSGNGSWLLIGVSLAQAAGGGLAVGITEGQSLEKSSAKSGSDSFAVGLTEGQSVLKVYAKSGSDSFAVGLTESQSVKIAYQELSRSDSVAVAVSEARTLESAIPRVDSVAIGLTESQGKTTLEPKAGSDSVAIGLTEARSVDAAVPRADSVAVAVTEEVAAKSAAIARSDAAAVALSESRAIGAALTKADSVAVALTEGQSVAQIVPKGGSDSVAIGLTEAVTAKSAAILRSDAAAVALTEASTMAAAIARADSVAVALSEAKQLSQLKVSSDSVAVSLTEAASVLKEFIRSDAVVVALGEVQAVDAEIARTDEVAVGLDEQTEVTHGETKVTESDDLAIGLVETQHRLDVTHPRYVDVDVVPWENRHDHVPYEDRTDVVPREPRGRGLLEPRPFAVAVFGSDEAHVGLIESWFIPPTEPPQVGLTAQYAFDEGAGDTAHDTSGNGRHLTGSGVQWTTQGMKDAAQVTGSLVLGSKGAAIIFASACDWEGGGSEAECIAKEPWMYVVRNSRNKTWPGLMTKSFGWFCGYMAQRAWAYHDLVGSGWHILTHRFNATWQTFLYADGTEKSQYSANSTPWGWGGLAVGGENYGSVIGYMLIYNRPLTDAEHLQARNWIKAKMQERGVSLP